jgi:hypothetical protein
LSYALNRLIRFGVLINNIQEEKDMETSNKRGLAIASMVLGIIGLVLACLSIGLFPAIIGLALGIVSLATHRGGHGMAIAGVVTSAIAVAIAVIILIMGAGVSEALDAESNKKLNKGGASATETEKKDDSKSDQKTDDSKAEPEDDGVIDFSTDTFAVKLTSYETSTDYEGNPCLLVYYDYTNNGSENSSAMTDCYFKAFQGGVECDSAITLDSNDSMENYMKEIQPGTTVNVCEAFKISGPSDVTLQASELISLSDDKDTQIIKLQ